VLERICLRDFLNQLKEYQYTHRTGQFSATLCNSQEERSADISGFARIVKLGLRPRVDVLVAMYVYEQTLWVRIGALLFDTQETGLLFERFGVAPFVKQFNVWSIDQLFLSTCYWHLDRTDDTPFKGDIFFMIQEHTSTRAKRLHITAFWEAMKQGRDVLNDAVYQEIKEKVNANLSQN
jgi:hypothetical protein